MLRIPSGDPTGLQIPVMDKTEIPSNQDFIDMKTIDTQYKPHRD